MSNKLIDGVSSVLLEGLTPRQKDVLKAKSSNILVNAGAGSGKTTVLTKRIIHLLKDEGYSLDDIIVLTFTDLAAKEMKDRIIGALSKETDPKLQVELSHIDEANIMTFDAFCHKLLVKYSAYSTIDASFSIGDEALFSMVKESIIESELIVSGFYKGPKTNELIESLGFDKPKSLVSLLVEIYDSLENELNPLEVLTNYEKDHSSKTFYNKIIDKIENIVRFKINKLSKIEAYPVDDKTQEYVDYLNSLSAELSNASDLEEIFNIVKSGLRKAVSPSQSVSSSDKELYKNSREEFKKVFGEISSLFDDFDSYNEIEDNYYKILDFESYLIGILYNAFEDMRLFKEEYNIYSFQDIAIECIDILMKHKEISDYYKAHIKEILIDEYQDTNDINSLLISLITYNNEVVVGDVKQSIYRFRNANPDIFTRRYINYENGGGTLINLDANFRSRKSEVIDIVNSIFYPLSKDDSLESSFFKDKMEYGLKEYSSHPHSLNGFKIIEVDSDDKEHSEADYIAQDIINRIKNHQKVYVPKEKRLREANFGDFMVLSYSGTTFNEYKKTFEKYGIPVQIHGDVTFGDSYEIIFIKNALKLVYLINSGSTDGASFDSTLISILRSFVLSLNDSMILKYMNEKKASSSIDAFNKVFPKLYESFMNLNETYNAYGTTKLLDEIINTFKIYESLFRLDEKESREAKLNLLINQLSTYAKSGMDLPMIINYFDYLKKNRIDTTARINALSDISCVNMMTIHKSKGLEAPIVYVANLNRKIQNRHINYSKDYGINLKFPKNIKNLLISYEERKEKNREFFRLLYVALTRARESLTLIFKSDKRTTNKDIYNFNNLQEFLVYNHEFDPNVYTTVDLDDSLKMKKQEIVFDSIPIEYENLNLKEKEVVERKHASHDVVNVDSETSLILERGTLLHSFFEITNFLGEIEKELELKKIADSYKKYLINFSKQDIFKTPSIREFHELPYYTNDSVGIIDYALEKENEFIIVDFKTSRIDDTEYVNQLHTYKDYIKTKTNKPIKTYLYSMMKNVLKEID